MGREIKEKMLVETSSPADLAKRIIELEENMVDMRLRNMTLSTENMHLRDTNYFLKDLIAKLAERGAE